MAKGGWVCGIDAGSFKTPSYVAWLSGSSFLLDLCSPTVTQPLPKPPSGVHNVQSYAIDAPQGLPGIGRKRRRCDELARTPTSIFPESLRELEHWKLYKGVIELGVKTFWHIYQSKDIRVFGLDDSDVLPVAAETYPRNVAETMGLKRLPSKRKDSTHYVDYVWNFLQSLGYRCESVIRPSVDHVDAMLCAIAAQSTVAGSNASEPLGDKPYVDKKASVLREGFIVVPSCMKV